MVVLIGAGRCQAGAAKWMARTLQSSLSIRFLPATPGGDGKTNREQGEKEEAEGKEPDIDPVTFLAAQPLWLLMTLNNLGWKNQDGGGWMKCQRCSRNIAQSNNRNVE